MDGETARPYLDRVRKRVSVVAIIDNAFRLHWTEDVEVVCDPPEKAIRQQKGELADDRDFPGNGWRRKDAADYIRPDMSLFGSSDASLHTKAFKVDNRTGFIGSFNWTHVRFPSIPGWECYSGIPIWSAR